MKRVMNAETAEKVVDSGIRAVLAAVYSGAALFGGYAPFAVGMAAAAGSGRSGFCALCGAIGGALLFLDFSHALRTAAACVLLFAANNAFCDLEIYRKPWFCSALTGGMMLCVEFVYVLNAGAEEIAGCLLSLLIAAGAAYSCRCVLYAEAGENGAAYIFVLLGLLIAISSAETDSGFAPGRIAAMLAVLLISFRRSRAQAIPSALAIGLAVDLAAAEAGYLHTAAYAFAALAMSVHKRGNRVSAALWYLGGILVFSLPVCAESGILLLYEGFAAALCFLLLPARFLCGKRERNGKEPEPDPWSIRLKSSAAALRELYESMLRVPKAAEESPAVIYDRAAEQVCRSCSLCNTCWEKEYTKSHTALNDATAALLRNGTATGGDFPAYFADRCIRLPELLKAINAELGNFLLRRSYRQRLGDVRRQAAGQYAQLSEMLNDTAEPAAKPASAPQLPYQVGIALRPKQGEKLSGDSAATFETEEGLCIILSDGMGSGENARKESAMAVRLVEKFLRAGIEPAPALKTLNSALTLRSELTDNFTTIDLLTLSLQTGEAEVFKYGAAPSYIKCGGRVRRINCSCLPAGLQGTPPEATRLRLGENTFFVMLTDGVVDAQEDEWLQNLLAGWEGNNPQLLVSAILADSVERKGKADDAGLVVLYLPQGNESREI